MNPNDWIPGDKYKGTEEEMKVLQQLKENGVDLSKFYIAPEMK